MKDLYDKMLDIIRGKLIYLFTRKPLTITRIRVILNT